jgi:hypothetical protein
MKREPSLSLENNSQVILSYELLALLSWMIRNEIPALKQMISKAITNKHRAPAHQANFATVQTAEDAHEGIIEFFGSLESLMIEVMNEQSIEKVLEKNLMPAIDHIDTAACDDALVRNSILKATSALKHHPHENPQHLLFKELLRQWRPEKAKKKIVH